MPLEMMPTCLMPPPRRHICCCRHAAHVIFSRASMLFDGTRYPSYYRYSYDTHAITAAMPPAPRHAVRLRQVDTPRRAAAAFDTAIYADISRCRYAFDAMLSPPCRRASVFLCCARVRIRRMRYSAYARPRRRAARPLCQRACGAATCESVR